jgi:WD40 repeat protein
VVFTPDGDQLILPVLTLSGNVWVAEDRMLHVWDIETDTSLETFQRMDVSTINAMMLSASGRFLAYTGYDRGGEGSVIVVVDLTIGAFWLWSLDGGLYPWGTVIAFSADESLLIFGMRRGMIRVVDTLTWDEIASFDSGDETISAVAVSADGTRLATGSTKGIIRLWGVPEQVSNCLRLEQNRGGSPHRKTAPNDSRYARNSAFSRRSAARTMPAWTFATS